MSVDRERIRKVAEAARRFHDNPDVDYYSVAEMYLHENPGDTDEEAAAAVAIRIAYP